MNWPPLLPIKILMPWSIPLAVLLAQIVRFLLNCPRILSLRLVGSSFARTFRILEDVIYY